MKDLLLRLGWWPVDLEPRTWVIGRPGQLAAGRGLAYSIMAGAPIVLVVGSLKFVSLATKIDISMLFLLLLMLGQLLIHNPFNGENLYRYKFDANRWVIPCWWLVLLVLLGALGLVSWDATYQSTMAESAGSPAMTFLNLGTIYLTGHFMQFCCANLLPPVVRRLRLRDGQAQNAGEVRR